MTSAKGNQYLRQNETSALAVFLSASLEHHHKGRCPPSKREKKHHPHPPNRTSHAPRRRGLGPGPTYASRGSEGSTRKCRAGRGSSPRPQTRSKPESLEYRPKPGYLPLKLQGLGKLIFYRHSPCYPQKVEKLCL